MELSNKLYIGLIQDSVAQTGHSPFSSGGCPDRNKQAGSSRLSLCTGDRTCSPWLCSAEISGWSHSVVFSFESFYKKYAGQWSIHLEFPALGRLWQGNWLECWGCFGLQTRPFLKNFWENSFKRLYYICLFIYWGPVRGAPWHACGNQRTTFESWFSISWWDIFA